MSVPQPSLTPPRPRVRRSATCPDGWPRRGAGRAEPGLGVGGPNAGLERSPSLARKVTNALVAGLGAPEAVPARVLLWLLWDLEWRLLVG